jgi:carbonic anhydrase/acetyltransferase-like protein (isoleucine patch superfamily)
MFITRNGRSPNVHPSAKVSPTAQIIGNVTIGEHCFIDCNAVIESSGAPIQIEDHVIILANAVIRSVGGTSRPPFAVRIGSQTLISPLCALAGCQIGRGCYIATGVMVFQGAVIGDASRVGAGAIVHLKTVLPPQTHVGMRHIAVPTEDGFLITADIQAARAYIAAADFFKTVFEADEQEQDSLQSTVMSKLLQEMLGWTDEPLDLNLSSQTF